MNRTKIILKYLLLLEVVGIISIHALVPHLHHGEMRKTHHIAIHQNKASLLSHLQNIFHHQETHLQTAFRNYFQSPERVSTGAFKISTHFKSKNVFRFIDTFRPLNKCINSSHERIPFGLRAPPLKA